jgi:hypothetical protein
MSELQNLIDKLLEQVPELTREIIDQKIAEKKERLRHVGVTTDQGALFYVAADYGVDKDEDAGDYRGIVGYDENGYDENGYDHDGLDSNGSKDFNITSKFSKIISSFNSDFDAFVSLAYNEPTKIRTKSFFSHDEKTGIYSKAFESFSNNNVVHFHIEKAGKQYGTIWNKPKDTGRLQGDNFESGYTLNVTFNKNDSVLKSILIKKLGKMNFGTLPSEYTLDCHLNEEYPNDERAKELLEKVVKLFNSEPVRYSRGALPKGFE